MAGLLLTFSGPAGPFFRPDRFCGPVCSAKSRRLFLSFSRDTAPWIEYLRDRRRRSMFCFSSSSRSKRDSFASTTRWGQQARQSGQARARIPAPAVGKAYIGSVVGVQRGHGRRSLKKRARRGPRSLRKKLDRPDLPLAEILAKPLLTVVVPIIQSRCVEAGLHPAQWSICRSATGSRGGKPREMFARSSRSRLWPVRAGGSTEL